MGDDRAEIAELRGLVAQLRLEVQSLDRRPPTLDDWMHQSNAVLGNRRDIDANAKDIDETTRLLSGSGDLGDFGIRGRVLGMQESLGGDVKRLISRVRDAEARISDLRTDRTGHEEQIKTAFRRIESTEGQLGRVERNGKHGVRKHPPFYQRPVPIAAGAGTAGAVVIEIVRLLVGG